MRTCRRSRNSLKDKVKPLSQLIKIIPKLKKHGKRIVFTNGCFDLMHYGHAKYLEEAKRKGDILIVGVNSDASIRRIKGKKRPIIGEEDRLHLVAALESVDFAVLFKEDTPLDTIMKIRPDILIKGADWKNKGIVGADFIKSYGGMVSTVELVKGLSTTNLIKIIVKSS